MKNKYIVKSILFLFIFLNAILIFSSTKAADLEIGGKFNTSITGYYSQDSEFAYIPQANLDWELFLPRWGNNEIRCAGNVYTNLEEGKIDFFWKKLYWKHRFDKFHLTVGRQPISWSFGSLLNPVDYSLGAEALDREYNAKYQDALELYYPINWHTSLSLTVSPMSNWEDFKIGIRGRTLVNDFDVAVHFIQEQIKNKGKGTQRFGITAKGDLGKYGVYGSLGYYHDEKKSYSFLLGVDYSYFFQTGSRLYLQAEYLTIPPEMLAQITGSIMNNAQYDIEKNIQLLVTNASYQIDEFSNIGMTVFYNACDNSTIFMPNYSNQIKDNINFKIQAGIINQSVVNTNPENNTIVSDNNRSGFIEIGFDYTF